MISARERLASSTLDYYPLSRLAAAGMGDPNRLPMTIKILLEGLLRQAEAGEVGDASLRALTRWPEAAPDDAELPYLPSRILLQDFTGVPAVVDLAAMRSAMQRAGKDAGRIDPLVQVDLVIDHSVQVDAFGSLGAYARNIEREYARNGERYALLRWAQQAFHNFSVVPPGMGICHQVNLERLSRVVQVRKDAKGTYALPDTLLGTDSHTTMVNGLGVLGWGVGGIEAEAALLGQPTYLPTPVVVGVRMTGASRGPSGPRIAWHCPTSGRASRPPSRWRTTRETMTWPASTPRAVSRTPAAGISTPPRSRHVPRNRSAMARS